MPAVEETQITKYLSKYKYVAATKKDVVDVVTSFRSLTYDLQRFVFNDGSSKELFTIQGTIPVVYKNNTYYIPICIWLMDTHPQNAPMCFVKPTPTMQIKVSMYVDHNGKVYLPYLHDWQPHSSDLLSLIQVMIVTFGDHPPVYSKPKEQIAAPYPTNSYMPQPGAPGGSNSFLPYPTAGGAGGSNFPPYPTGSNVGPYPPTPAGPAGGSGYPAYPNFIQPTAGGYPPAAGYNPSNPSSTGTITEEHIKASIISAIDDKLRRRVQEKVNQYQAEIETLNRTKQELLEGSAKIDAIIERLEREHIDMQKNISILKDKEQELEKALEDLESAEAINPDEAVTTTAPLYRQLLNAYADEAATEDAIYYLGEGLRGGVIDLETFLKHVRQLSRKQFILRATMQKCRQKAGLAG
uniref:Tumor suppressor protein 101 n=2 Tax=Drosophila melanogaster TaxID=7227 RepID=Q9VVA7_DROME|nr:tumor susceptibility gene 101 [Drosophila melanogaster]AAF49406.2 tumor susceptibility gene 101 [Drosophila melanogaster]AAG29564.1 tumor suppressor protein 101 [Drosophila melanogaster]|eukprot:NP_524120.1 tumor susceptibility gene 101 [Drosophila melanogaster]